MYLGIDDLDLQSRFPKLILWLEPDADLSSVTTAVHSHNVRPLFVGCDVMLTWEAVSFLRRILQAIAGEVVSYFVCGLNVAAPIGGSSYPSHGCAS